MSKEKKYLGFWGENYLDSWMHSQHWYAIEKNLRIYGGEIDRVYAKQQAGCDSPAFCVAEVKTRIVHRRRDLQTFFTESSLGPYFRQRQMRNLYRYGETLQAHTYQKIRAMSTIYLRLFLVLKHSGLLAVGDFKNNGYFGTLKCCFFSQEAAVLSFQPEYTCFLGGKSSLQSVVV